MSISTGAEVEAGYRWLEATLQADTELIGLLRPGGDDGTATNADRIPDSAPLPAVQFSFQGGSDQRIVGPGTVWLTGVWLVRVVTEEDGLDQAGPIAKRIQLILHGKHASPVPGGFGTVWECIRESAYSLAETSEDGRTFRHLGGFYRIRVTSS